MLCKTCAILRNSYWWQKIASIFKSVYINSYTDVQNTKGLDFLIRLTENWAKDFQQILGQQTTKELGILKQSCG